MVLSTILTFLLLATTCLADPETVEGLYLTKRGGGSKRRVAAEAAATAGSSSFPQAHLGSNSNGWQQQPRAFQGYLGHQEGVRPINGWFQSGWNNKNKFNNKAQTAALPKIKQRLSLIGVPATLAPPKPVWPQQQQQQWRLNQQQQQQWRPQQQQQQPLRLKQQQLVNPGTFKPTPIRITTTNTTTKQPTSITSTIIPKTTTSTTASPITSTTTKPSTSLPTTTTTTTKVSPELPRAIPVKQESKRASPDGFDGSDYHKSLAGALLGVAFVAAFVGVAIALAAGRLMRMADPNGDNQHGNPLNFASRLSSPEDDDRTPPELRGCNGHASFVQPTHQESGGRKSGRKSRRQEDCNNGQHFFTGQLILHEARKSNQTRPLPSQLNKQRQNNSPNNPSTCLLTSDSLHVTSRLAAAQASVMMPSPAEQVTDDLISPKYDDEDDEEEEEDSDDTVYECPGLASTGEMVVSNPFFMQGGDLDESPSPKPISHPQSSIFHHGIKGVN